MWRVVLLLLIGLAFPMLLNGQSFTNYIVGSACSLAAAGFGLLLCQKPQYSRAKRVTCCVATVLGSAWGLFLIACLPAAYEHQVRFNSRMREIVEKMAEP